MDQDSTNRMPAPERVGCMLRAFYDALDAEERKVLDFVLRQAVEHVAEQAGADRRSDRSVVRPVAQPATHNVVQRVHFGVAGVTDGLATPGVINWLVASARDANLLR